MRGGLYEGHNSLELLKESAEWLEARIDSAFSRAGFDPSAGNLVTTCGLCANLDQWIP